MSTEFKNPILVYPIELLEQAIYAAAHQNHEQDKKIAEVGETIKLTDEHLAEARHLLTSKEMDYANYVPEDENLPVIVMLNSYLARGRHTVKRLSNIPFNELQLGDKLISNKNTPGKITGLTPIEESWRQEGDQITIIWDNGKTSNLWHFQCQYVQYVGKE